MMLKVAAAMAVVLLAGLLYLFDRQGHLEGRYSLVSVDGQGLPFRIFDGNEVAQNVIRGSLVIAEGGAIEFVTELENLMMGASVPQVDTAIGVYTGSEDSIVATVRDGPPFSLHRTAEGLTVDVEGLLFFYRREVE